MTGMTIGADTTEDTLFQRVMQCRKKGSGVWGLGSGIVNYSLTIVNPEPPTPSSRSSPFQLNPPMHNAFEAFTQFRILHDH